MRIDSGFEGGNINVLSIQGDDVKLAVDLRDTEGDWFYWAFRVYGAGGRTLNFDFIDKKRVGYYGAAVSADNYAWRWSETADDTYTKFTYSFDEDENVVYFCHDMRYGTLRFYALADRLGLPVLKLAKSERGRDVPYARFGEGSESVLIAARHHACESTGNYVMEGILEELHKNNIPDMSVIVVPFVDMDGVVDGDQGKNRKPYDHNRDYADKSIYASVAAIRKIVESENIVYFFDLHAPGHFSGRHDVCHNVRISEESDGVHDRFGGYFEEETKKDVNAYPYHVLNDLHVNVEWNIRTSPPRSFTGVFNELPQARLCYGLETPYFGKPESIVNKENLVAMGHCLARSIIRAKREGL